MEDTLQREDYWVECNLVKYSFSTKAQDLLPPLPEGSFLSFSSPFAMKEADMAFVTQLLQDQSLLDMLYERLVGKITDKRIQHCTRTR